MHLTFGTDTDDDLLETLFGRLRGYTVSVGPGSRAVDYRLLEVAPEGRWTLLFEPIDPDGQPAGPPCELPVDDLGEMTIY